MTTDLMEMLQDLVTEPLAATVVRYGEAGWREPYLNSPTFRAHVRQVLKAVFMCMYRRAVGNDGC